MDRSRVVPNEAWRLMRWLPAAFLAAALPMMGAFAAAQEIPDDYGALSSEASSRGAVSVLVTGWHAVTGAEPRVTGPSGSGGLVAVTGDEFVKKVRSAGGVSDVRRFEHLGAMAMTVDAGALAAAKSYDAGVRVWRDRQVRTFLSDSGSMVGVHGVHRKGYTGRFRGGDRHCPNRRGRMLGPGTARPVAARLAWALAPLPAGAASDAPGAPMDRGELTGRLVPVTGDEVRSVDLTVPFARNSAKLTEPAREQLAELGKALADERLREFEVGVYGHTDATGAAAYYRKLSELRARAVVDYLVERAGLDWARFRHGGFGEERLLEGVHPNSTRHRRVEVVVYGAAGGTPEGAGAKSGKKDDERTEGKRDESGLQAIQ